MRSRGADVLHTHTAKAGATGRIAALLPEAPAAPGDVHTFHGHVLSGYFGPRRERVFIEVERLLARRTGAIIAVSDEVRDDLVRLGVAAAQKIVVIPYGSTSRRCSRRSTRQRARRRAEVGVPADAFVIGWAGRLTPIKRPHDLVRVLAEVTRQRRRRVSGRRR